MAIHPETQKVIDYPETLGKSIALKHYNWQLLDKTQEVMVASNTVNLAKLIDDNLVPSELSVFLNEMLMDRLNVINEHLNEADDDELSEMSEAWLNEKENIERILSLNL